MGDYTGYLDNDWVCLKCKLIFTSELAWIFNQLRDNDREEEMNNEDIIDITQVDEKELDDAREFQNTYNEEYDKYAEGNHDRPSEN